MKKLALITAIGLALTATVWAGGISVYPLINEILLPPGTSYSDVINIANTGDTAVTITVTSMGFMAPEGIPIFLNPADDHYPYSGRDLLTVEPTQVVVNPSQTVEFHYTVKMPKDLEPYGGRYVAAVFKAQPETTGNAQVVVATQVASLFFLDPGGKAAPHLKLTQPKVYPKVDNPHDIVLEVSVENDGNLHINSDQMRGFVFITDQDGYVIDLFPAKSHTILPHNVHIHREIWHAPQDLPSGTYIVHFGLVLFAPDPEHPQYLFLSTPIKLEF